MKKEEKDAGQRDKMLNGCCSDVQITNSAIEFEESTWNPKQKGIRSIAWSDYDHVAYAKSQLENIIYQNKCIRNMIPYQNHHCNDSFGILPDIWHLIAWKIFA